MKAKNKTFLTAVALCLSVTLAVAAWGDEIIHIGIPTLGLSDFPVEIARAKGFYNEEGLDVRQVIVKTGLQPPALIAGEIDYSTVCGTGLRAAMKGMPIRIIMGWFDKPLHMLIARPEIKTLENLKGKKIAVSSIGSTPHAMLKEALKRKGLDPEREVVIVSVGGSGARFAALQAGSVDASPLDVVYINKTEKLGFRNLLYFGDVLQHPLGGMCTSRRKIEQERDEVKKILRATYKGVRFFKENKGGTVELLRNYLKLDREFAGKAYDFALGSLHANGITGKESRETEESIAKQQLKIKGELPESQLYDWSLVREVMATTK